MHENRETSSLTGSQETSPAGKGKSHNPGTHGGEESDGVVLPMNPANKATEQPAEAAEPGEGRTPTKENIDPPRTPPAQEGFGVSPRLFHNVWPVCVNEHERTSRHDSRHCCTTSPSICCGKATSR